MVKTSVIIPVYNTQEYIGECLDSLFSQTQKEIEIIAVDDGSTDNSLEIIKSYQKEHNNLKIVCQKNMKLGAARNAGMKIARGKCIYFLDSDDLIEKNALEILYQKLEMYNLDFVSFDAGTFGNAIDDAERFKYYDRSGLRINTEKVYSGFDFWNQFYLEHDPMVTAWSFYFKKEFLDKYSFRFQENLFFEDSEFAVKAYLNSERMMYVPHKLYKRRIRQGSIMLSKFDIPHLRGLLSNVKLVCKYINEDLHTTEEKKLFLKFWRAQFGKILRQWNEVENQKDKNTLDLAGGIIKELSKSVFLAEYLDRQLYQDLQMFLQWLLEEAYYPDGRNEVLIILEKWYEENVGLCIYGIGKIAEKVIVMLRAKKIKRKKIVFAVTENTEGIEEYQGYPLIEIKDLPQCTCIEDIIIASTKYEDEMLEGVHALFNSGYRLQTYRELLINVSTKVSIIVPVYNGEKYLKRCISSLLQQSHTNIEVIIVNDGSSDASETISMAYKANDKRCIVLNQQNRGVMSARKEGIRKSTGDFIVFVDSDDWIEPDMIAKMLLTQEKSDTDIVIMGHVREMENGKNKKEMGQISAGIYGEDSLKLFYEKMFYVSPVSGWGIWPTLWGKLYKKDVIKYAIERVDDRIIYGEDTAVLFTACFVAERIVLVENYLYHYFTINENSVSKAPNKKLLDSMYFLYGYMKNLFTIQEENEILLEQLGWYMNNILNHVSRVLFDIPYYLSELFYARKEAEQWRQKYNRLAQKTDIVIEKMRQIVDSHEWLLPYEELGNMRNIVLFGAGEVADNYRVELEHDNNYTLLVHMQDISEIKKLSNISYDCILIATDDIHEKCVMEMELLKRGVDEKKIIWKEPFKG